MVAMEYTMDTSNSDTLGTQWQWADYGDIPISVISFPDPTSCEKKGLGTGERIVGCAPSAAMSSGKQIRLQLSTVT